MMRSKIAVVVVLFALTGCLNLAPDYQRPALPVAQTWPVGEAYATNPLQSTHADVQDSETWHHFVLDRALQQCVALALNHNRDLRLAALNITKAQAQYRIQRAQLLPSINASFSNAGSLVPAELNATRKPEVMHNYNVGVGFNAFELDFFGRLTNLKESALEYYLATEAAQRSVRLSLIAQVVTAYMTMAADQAHLSLSQKTLKDQQTSYALYKRRFELGVASQLELSQAQTTVDTASKDVARYTSLVAQDRNALTLLAGVAIPEKLLPTKSSSNDPILAELVTGLPSDLLFNRPDIGEAEHALKAANANIGVARAAFFPRITLTTAIGTASSQLSGLFQPGSRSWLFEPIVSLPIFDAGSHRANLAIAQTNRDIGVAQYEKAIQSAFREVADGLADRGTLGEQLAAQQSLVDATTQSYTLSTARFQHGIASFLHVLDSERALYSAQHDLINLKLAKENNLVALYKALGGVVVAEQKENRAMLNNQTKPKNLEKVNFNEKESIEKRIDALAAASMDPYTASLPFIASAELGDKKRYESNRQHLLKKLEELDDTPQQIPQWMHNNAFKAWMWGRVLLAADSINDTNTATNALGRLHALQSEKPTSGDNVAFLAWSWGYRAAYSQQEYNHAKQRMLDDIQTLTTQFKKTNEHSALSDALWTCVMNLQAAAYAGDMDFYNGIKEQIKSLVKTKTVTEGLEKGLLRTAESNDFPAWAMAKVRYAALLANDEDLSREIEKTLKNAIEGALKANATAEYVLSTIENQFVTNSDEAPKPHLSLP